VYEAESYQPIKITPDVFKTSYFQELNISTLQDVQEVFGSKEKMLAAFQFIQIHLYEGVAS
jgi:type I restriction enzyme, R subunit